MTRSPPLTRSLALCPPPQVKSLRVLQYFPAPEDPTVHRTLVEVLKRILGGSEPVKNVNKNNAVHAIVFEVRAGLWCGGV